MILQTCLITKYVFVKMTLLLLYDYWLFRVTIIGVPINYHHLTYHLELYRGFLCDCWTGFCFDMWKSTGHRDIAWTANVRDASVLWLHLRTRRPCPAHNTACEDKMIDLPLQNKTCSPTAVEARLATLLRLFQQLEKVRIYKVVPWIIIFRKSCEQKNIIL